MFNAPRRTNPSLSQSAFFQTTSTPSGGYVDPLAASLPAPGGDSGSGFGDVDPWSGMASPVRSGTPGSAPIAERRDSAGDALVPPSGVIVEDAYTRLPGQVSRGGGGGGGGDGLKELMADPPALYVTLLDQVDTTPSGEIPLSSVQRLLSSAQLSAATLEKVCLVLPRWCDSFPSVNVPDHNPHLTRQDHTHSSGILLRPSPHSHGPIRRV